MTTAAFSKITNFITNIKKQISDKLSREDNGIIINCTNLKDITPNQLTIYIQQFYQNIHEQQVNTIQLPIDYDIKGLLTNKESELTNSAITYKYGSFFGIHQDFYWLYFYKDNSFISFYDDKILFTLNDSQHYNEAHNLALLDKEPQKAIYQLYKNELCDLIERSKRVIHWFHDHQSLKDQLTQDNNSEWPAFFNSPIILSRFDNKVFEIINPQTHLPPNMPIGYKILCYPFEKYLENSAFYSKYKNSKPISLEAYLTDSLSKTKVSHNFPAVDSYCGEIRRIAKADDLDQNIAYSTISLSNLFNMLIDIKRQIYELCEIKVVSPKTYHLFGFLKFIQIPKNEILDKVWITYDPDCISNFTFQQDYVYTEYYDGSVLNEPNIDIINRSIALLNEYVKRLEIEINKTGKQFDQYNITLDSVESCNLLHMLTQELKKAQLHQEYLDDFKYQLFPPDDEVI